MLFLILFSFIAIGQVQADTYKIDASHSSVAFKIRHLVGNVKGSFSDFSGEVIYNKDDISKSSVKASIASKSIDTNNEKRDSHLKNEDFFNVEKFPKITFVSKRIEGNKIIGDLSMHGITKEVVLDAEVSGVMKDPWGKTRAGFSATAIINRNDFGVSYNKLMEAGGLMLGENVSIELEIEAVLQE